MIPDSCPTKIGKRYLDDIISPLLWKGSCLLHIFWISLIHRTSLKIISLFQDATIQSLWGVLIVREYVKTLMAAIKRFFVSQTLETLPKVEVMWLVTSGFWTLNIPHCLCSASDRVHMVSKPSGLWRPFYTWRSPRLFSSNKDINFWGQVLFPLSSTYHVPTRWE